MLPKSINGLIKRLNDAGFEAYGVGGCIRDSLLGLKPKDYDICTSARPEQTKLVFSDKKVIDTGLKHGTVTVISDGEATEITTFRTDGEYKDGRHPESVCFTEDIQKDLSRRDFTVNAMAYSEKKGIIDPFGGRRDLDDKLIRCVGEPERRFREDALRILRALRFSACYSFRLERKTAAALHSCKNLLKNVSAERVNAELQQILCGNCGYVLREFYDVFAEIIPEIADCHSFLQYSKYHDRDVWEHTVSAVEAVPPVFHLRLTMLLHDLGKPACFKKEDDVGHFKGHGAVSKAIAERVTNELRCDGETAKKVVFLVARHDMPMNDESSMIKRQLSKFGEENYFDLLKIHCADDFAKAADYRGRIEIYKRAEHVAKEIIRENQCFSLKNLAVNGNDLLKSGYSGKEIGEALDFLLEAVIDEKCTNTAESLMKHLESIKKE